MKKESKPSEPLSRQGRGVTANANAHRAHLEVQRRLLLLLFGQPLDTLMLGEYLKLLVAALHKHSCAAFKLVSLVLSQAAEYASNFLRANTHHTDCMLQASLLLVLHSKYEVEIEPLLLEIS